MESKLDEEKASIVVESPTNPNYIVLYFFIKI